MSRLRVTAVAGALVLGLGGCAASPKPLQPQAIQAARQDGSLKALYDQNTARIAGRNLASRSGREALHQHNELGRQLVLEMEAALQQERQQQLTPEGLAPLPLLEAQAARLPQVIRWEPAAYARLTAAFKELIGQTRAAVDARQEELAQLGQADSVKRVGLLASLGGLTRDPRYERERADVLAAMRQRIDEGIRGEQYPEARQAILELKQITPDDAALPEKLILVDTRLFEREFWGMLADGRVDEAYARFMTFTEQPDFPTMLQLLGGSAADMVAYFVAQAGTALSENRYADTYHLLNQVRDLRLRVQVEGERAPQEQAFLKTLFDRYEAAASAGSVGLAMGYLKVIERFDAEYPGLQDGLKALQEVALARATRRIDLAGFTNATGKGGFGGEVAESLTTHIAGKMPKGLQLIDSKAPAAIGERTAAARKSRKARKEAAPEAPAPDYVIQGQILESRVDTTEEKGRKTMRVTTGETRVENPAHAEWAALPEEERAGRPEPEAMLTQEAVEDVGVELRVQRKVGVITASYRLVEAATGKVLASGSETVREEFRDEGNDGVEAGDFRLEQKQPRLPDDGEIMQRLSARISGVIGDRLVQELRSPAERYAEAARRFVDEGNLALAADNEAFSFTLSTLNGQETSAQALEQYAVKAL